MGPNPWNHPNARRLLDLFRAAVLLENGLEEGGISDPRQAHRLRLLLKEIRRLGANGRRLIPSVGPDDRAVAAVIREMKAKLTEAVDIFGGGHDAPADE